nr:hypothetical protein [Tanacetum cinerariifolium]
FPKASIDESNIWHRRLGHVNFKTMNKLVKGNLVRGLPSKIFKNDHTCVACQKGKQHKATWIKREYSNARTLRQNRVTERKNMTLIEAVRTMLADSLLPITFWAEVVNTACYVINRALVTKSHNKTPYELLNDRAPRLDFMRPFGCSVTILNTLDSLGKFKGKADEGFLVGYSVTSKAFRGIKLTKMEVHKILMVMQSSISSTFKSSNDKAADDKPKDDTGSKIVEEPVNRKDQTYRDELDWLMSHKKKVSDLADALINEFGQGCMDQRLATKAGSTTVLILAYDDDLDIFTSTVQSMGVEADFNNIESSTIVSFIPTHRVHIDHPKDQILGDPKSAIQTKRVAKKNSRAYAFIEPKKVAQALDDETWVETMQEENKRDKKGIVVRNKARLAAQGHRQEEKIDYDEVFAPGASIEAIRIFLAFASFMGFIVYQMNVKSAFLYGIIEKKVYVSQPPSFIDPQFSNKIPDEFHEGAYIILRTAVNTSIETQKPLVKDEEATDVDVYLYKSMIGSLMYLTASRPDIMFAVCAYSRFHVTPKLSHLYAVKRIFRCPKGQPKLGLWRLISWQCKKQTIVATSTTKAEYVAAVDRTVTPLFETMLAPPVVIEGGGDSLVRAATTASLDAQHDSSNITKTQSKVTLNEPTSQREGSGSSLGRQETMGGAMAHIRSEGALIQSIDPPLSTGYTVGSGEDRMEHEIELTDPVPQTPHDSPLFRGYTIGSDEGSMTLKELIDFCTTLLQKVLDLENVKSVQAKEIASFKKKVTKLEQRQSSRFSGFYLFSDDEDADTEMIVEDKGNGEKRGSTAEMVSTARSDISALGQKDAEVALKIQADLDKEAKTKRERQEEASKAALAEMYDEVQAHIDVDHELAVRLTHKEQKKYTVEEREKVSLRLEAENESTLPLDLIKFIKLQIEEK